MVFQWWDCDLGYSVTFSGWWKQRVTDVTA